MILKVLVETNTAHHCAEFFATTGQVLMPQFRVYERIINIPDQPHGWTVSAIKVGEVAKDFYDTAPCQN